MPVSPEKPLPIPLFGARETDSPPRILFVKLSSLGDVVHSLPVIEALRIGLGPNVTICWAVRKRFAPLVLGNPHLNAAYELEGSRAKDLWSFGRSLKAQKFNVALDAQGLFISGLLTRLSDAGIRIGLDRNREMNALFLTNAVVPSRSRRHIVDILMGFCDVVGVPRVPPRPQTYLLEGEANAAGTLMNEAADGDVPVVGCIIGASTIDKTWPVARWAETAGKLARGGVRVALLGGAGESAAAREIEAAAPAGSIGLNLVGQTPLPLLASVLGKCDVVIGGDSGPTHLAVAVGTSVVGLYGVTDPVRTGPDWGPSPSIVIDFAEVDAPPAGRRPRHNTLPEALSRIPADAVAAAVFQMLADSPHAATR